ncbi:unnamed protein product, partial [Mesorhabditis belari]|uniref:AMP-dependent synthetase/ligase domain-containing protein n=1 Tax=Mesorhabditis belari TaxID=2138241 RepID=A0AAF3EUA2_9BILA
MVLRSDVNLARPKQPLHLALLEKCAYFEKEMPDLVAFRNSADHSDFLTYGRLKENILRVGNYFHSNGFKKGEVCAFVLPNCWEFAVSMVGAWTAGMTASAASVQFTHYEIHHQLVDSEAVVVITEDTYLEKVLQAVKDVPRIREIISIQSCPSPLPPNVIPFDKLLSTSPNFDPQTISIDMDNDLITLPYSSGTTGAPKGVMITHLNLAYTLDIFLDNERRKWEAMGVGLEIIIGKTSLAVLPQYHAMGMFTMVSLAYSGVQQVMFRKYNLRSLLEHTEKFEVTVLILVPAIITQLASSPLLDQFDLSSVMSISCGSAPLSKNVIDKIKSRLPITIRQSYGMTEMSLGSHFSRLDQPDEATGKLNANMEMKVLSQETGKECGPMEVGELRVKGPVVMKGYKNRPDDTAKTFDEEGFLITGDLVYYDQDGYLYVCERTKELIKVKGAQVAPAELEDLILGIDGVLDCAVTGIPDERNGEVPRAFIVRRGNHPTEEEIHRYVNERVARYKRLDGGITFIDAIPRTPSGKMLRRKLKELYLQETNSKSKL